MKKNLSMLLIALAVFAVIVSCGSDPAPAAPTGPQVSDQVMKPDILEHKGTAVGGNAPAWVMAYIEEGPRGVEKLPEYKDKFVIVLESEGQSKQGTELAMDNMDAPVQIAKMLSTRVEQKFAGAQVGDRNQVEEYMENVVKLVSAAKFTGFTQGPSWWVYLQYYKVGAKTKAEVEKRVYRFFKVYYFDKNVLQTQIDKYLKEAEVAAAKTPEKKRAIENVQNAFYEGF